MHREYSLDKMGDWSIELVLTFLDIYEHEPILWNPKTKTPKDRHTMYEAWRRVQRKMGDSFTVNELKRKKDSLMASYRTLENRIKQSCTQNEEIYQPTWFAFPKMAGFLRDRDTEAVADNEKDTISETHESTSECSKNLTINQPPIEKFVYKLPRPPRKDKKLEKLRQNRRRKGKCPEASTLSENHRCDRNEEYSLEKVMNILKTTTDSNDTFGEYVASELKNLKSEYNRQRLKNEIRNSIARIAEQDFHQFYSSSSANLNN